jgi:hypothetical protein
VDVAGEVDVAGVMDAAVALAPLFVRIRTATQQLLVSKVQCGTHAPVWAEPGSVVTVVSEKSLRRRTMTPRLTSGGVIGNDTMLLGTAH